MQEFLIFRCLSLRRVEYDQHQVCVGQRFHRFANADRLRFVESLANASRIDQFDRDAADRDRLADQVARRARVSR